VEHRSHKGTIEVRANADGAPIITGYAAVFNRDSADLGFIEQVDPRAFDKTLKEADVRGLGNHEPDWLLGRSKSGTLRLSADSVGLRYEIDVNPADPDGVRAIEKVRRGDMDGSSFSFQTIRDEWNWEASPPQRRLLEVALIDVGPVSFPAYPDATATARALEPMAERLHRPVDELVTALKTGEIRSLLSKEAKMTPESRAANGTLVWGPEEGFNDLISDLNEQLGVYGAWRYYACDVTLDLTRALICDGSEGEYFVAPITVTAEEPVLSGQAEWVQVESGWITADNEEIERSLRLLAETRALFARETRAGKTISKASAAKIQEAHDHLMAAAKGLRDLIDVANSQKPEGDDDPDQEAHALDIDVEMRLRELAIRGEELAAA